MKYSVTVAPCVRVQVTVEANSWEEARRQAVLDWDMDDAEIIGYGHVVNATNLDTGEEHDY